jgi:hypothetical protein
MSREEIYHWKIKTADSWRAGTEARISLSLHGDSGDVARSRLVPEYSYLDEDLPPDARGKHPSAWLPRQPLRERPKDFARNVVTLGQFPMGPSIGALETGVLLSDGSGSGADWQVEYVRIMVSRSAYWLADNVGLVKGGVEKRLTFVLEFETEFSPMAWRRKNAALKELARTDPLAWLAQNREKDRMIASVRDTPYAEQHSRNALLEAGWNAQQVEELLAGRSVTSQEILGRIEEGSRVPTVVGTRVRGEEGVRVHRKRARLKPIDSGSEHCSALAFREGAGLALLRHAI